MPEEGINLDHFESDKFYDEFAEEHKGHEKEVEDGFNKTVRYEGTFNPPTDAEAYCPKCDVRESVVYHKRICTHHKYGEHIEVECSKCGEVGKTKNIKYIGARSVFISCSCRIEHIEHDCDQ